MRFTQKPPMQSRLAHCELSMQESPFAMRVGVVDGVGVMVGVDVPVSVGVIVGVQVGAQAVDVEVGVLVAAGGPIRARPWSLPTAIAVTPVRILT